MMNEPELSESAEELLANLWVAKAEHNETSRQLGEIEVEDRETAVAQLEESGLVGLSGGAVSLTPSGEREAGTIIRRERLAERLLTDVLALGEEQATEAACRFEHLLRRGIDDQVCTLLGHPKVCPHGSPIPPGDCCRARARSVGTMISALADLAPGQRGTIAYMHGTRREMIPRMLAMGAAPGVPVTVLQTAPSYVFQVGQTQVAVDRETAEDIYVRVAAWPEGPARGRRWFRRRRGWGD